MNIKPEHIKELLKKQAEGTLTAEEAGQLKLAKLVHDDDEWLDMIAEVLMKLNKEHPLESLKGWRPDFDAIIKKAEQDSPRRKTSAYGKRSVFACLSLLLAVAGFYVFKKYWTPPPMVGDCAPLAAVTNIPLKDFYCMLRVGDSVRMVANNGKRGVIAQTGNLEIRMEEPGTLTFHSVPTAAADSTKPLFVEVLTAGNQQCIVVLPDKSRFWLNATSSLKYDLRANQDTTIHQVQLMGDAYVQVSAKKQSGQLVIETANSQLRAAEAEFTVSAISGKTRATLLSGSLTAVNSYSNLTQHMERAGDLTVIKSFTDIFGKRTDSLFVSRTSVDQAIRWTKTTRTYNNVSLREFVQDMSRWYGFRVKKMDCIPADLRISASVCYQAPEEEVFAAIRKAGVVLYKENGMISFCEPDPKKEDKVFALLQ